MPRNRATFVVIIRFVYFVFWLEFFNKKICCNKTSYFNVFGFNKRNIYSIVTKFVQYKILIP